MGVPAWALDAAASFAKHKVGRQPAFVTPALEPPTATLCGATRYRPHRRRQVGSHAFVYVNECDRPFQPNLAYNGSFVNGPDGAPGPGVPKALDVISIVRVHIDTALRGVFARRPPRQRTS